MSQQNIKDILDIDYIKRNTPDIDKLKIKLKKTFKGISIICTKPIKKGNIIAYYKIKVYKDDDNFHGIKKNMYTFEVKTKNGNSSEKYIGDIYEGSLETPKYGIPFWGYFANEPTSKQRVNAEINTNVKENYKNKDRVKEGDTLVYKLVAKENIEVGEEVCWYYGEFYKRDYEISI